MEIRCATVFDLPTAVEGHRLGTKCSDTFRSHLVSSDGEKNHVRIPKQNQLFDCFDFKYDLESAVVCARRALETSLAAFSCC